MKKIKHPPQNRTKSQNCQKLASSISEKQKLLKLFFAIFSETSEELLPEKKFIAKTFFFQDFQQKNLKRFRFSEIEKKNVRIFKSRETSKPKIIENVQKYKLLF